MNRQVLVTISIVASLLIAGIVVGAVYLGYRGPTSLVTTTSQTSNLPTSWTSRTTALSPTTYSTTSSKGLELQVTVGSATVQTGWTLGAQLALVNTLPTNLSLTQPANQDIASWNNYDFVCSSNTVWSLMGYALFEGHYSSVNITSAGNPLALAPPVALPCVYTGGGPSSIVLFLPRSTNFVAYYSLGGASAGQHQAKANATTEFCATFSNGSGVCPELINLVGYWIGPDSLGSNDATTSSKYFRFFAPGQYTLAVEDAWGDVVYAYFWVTRATPGGPHTVTFRQKGACSPQFWGVPWSVTMGNHTEAQPNGTNLPLSDFAIGSTTNQSLSMIAFSLPDGLYQYEVRPSSHFFTPDFGVIDVRADMTIEIAFTGTSCIANR